MAEKTAPVGTDTTQYLIIEKGQDIQTCSSRRRMPSPNADTQATHGAQQQTVQSEGGILSRTS